MPSHDISLADKINDKAATSYACPMHLDVRQNGPGKCSECGMNLLASTDPHIDAAQPMNCCHGPSQVSPASSQTLAYACPMHPEIQHNELGQYPTCGMNLAAVSSKPGGLMRRLFGRHDRNA